MCNEEEKELRPQTQTLFGSISYTFTLIPGPGISEWEGT